MTIERIKKMNSNIIKYLASAAMALGLVASVQAAQISGGISLAGNVTLNGGLNTATAFTSFTAVQVTSVAGSFSGVGITLNTPGSVTMVAFSFNPFPSAGLIPLWQTVSGTAASFDLSSPIILQQPGDNTLTLKGSGTLHLAGFDATPGDWVFTANSLGGTFSFSSSNGAVPDGGTTILLLGAALSGLALIRRKLA